MPWVYCHLPMNQVEEGCLCCIFGYERHSIFLIMSCCNVFINWVLIVLKFSGSSVTLMFVSRELSAITHPLAGDLILEGISQGSSLGPSYFDLCE